MNTKHRTIKTNKPNKTPKTAKSIRSIRISDLLPGCLLLSVWPCLVHADRIRTGLENESWYPAFPYADDYFMHIRSIAFLILAGWMLVVLIRWQMVQVTDRVGHDRVICLLTGCFLFLTGLSWLLSKHRQFGLRGLIESCETFPVICGYAVTFFYGASAAKRLGIPGLAMRPSAGQTLPKENDFRSGCVRILLYALLAGLLLQELIGFSQLAGHDFWQSSPGRFLLFLGRSPETLADMSGMGRDVYLSFYNPNYAAVYLLVMLPLLAGLLPTVRAAAGRALICLLLAGGVICLIGTGTAGGILTLLLLILFAAALLPAQKKTRLCCIFAVLGAMALTIAAGCLLPGNNPVKRIREKLTPKRTKMVLAEVVPGEDMAKVVFRNKQIYLDVHEDSGTGEAVFQVLNEELKPWPLRQKENGRLRIDAKGFGALAFDVYQEGEGQTREVHLIMYYGHTPWHFIWNGTLHYLNPQGKEMVPQKAKLSIRKDIPGWLSGRMYIWSVTLPLLKKAILTGYGPESFPFVFPRSDLITRCNIGVRCYREIIWRPHSLYLQIAAGSGLLSLAAFAAAVVLMVAGMIRKIRLARASHMHEKRVLLTGLLLAFLSFLIMGLTTDSVVVVTPLWALLAGICLGV